MMIEYGGFFTPLDSEPLKMGGVGQLKTQKKKPNFGKDTHVTLNPHIPNRLAN